MPYAERVNATMPLVVEQHGRTALVRLARPDIGNPVDDALLDALTGACGRLADDREVRVLVLAGRPFGRGWPEERLAGLREAPPDLEGLAAFNRRWFAMLAEVPQPVIAAVGGDCLGASFELALAADIRMAGADARFGFSEVALGRLPLAGGVSRLVRATGRPFATRLLLLGEAANAREAHAAGLVHRVVEADDLEMAALRLADAIASRGPLGERFAKEAVRRGLDMPLEQALRYETDLTVILQTTADRAEGVAAFLEKRRPRFTGD